MSSYQTTFGSLDKYEKGALTIINDDPKNYCFSNIFDVASKSKPYEKIAVGKNLEYVIEAVRAEGTSDWFAASHDEFVLVMDGEVTVTLMELASHSSVVPASSCPERRKEKRWEPSASSADIKPCYPKVPLTSSPPPNPP